MGEENNKRMTHPSIFGCTILSRIKRDVVRWHSVA